MRKQRCSAKELRDKIQKMQPLIILGMHRSGTSLTVRLLKDLGIHMGDYLSRDAEAVYFQKINRMIYRSAGSNWGDIDELIELMNYPLFVDTQTEKVLKTVFPENFLVNINKGISTYFGDIVWNQICMGQMPWWGWKDPRTTLTFPIWIQVFPQARFLNIMRNGIDVAISIHKRSLKQRKKYWKRLFPLDYISKTLDFKYCFQLWEKHVAFLDEKKVIIPSERYLEIRYEDLLANPKQNINSIARFIEFPLQDKNLDGICEQIDTGRLINTTYAIPYMDQIPSLVNSRWMQKYNYTYQVGIGEGESL